ncbi:hypothetical protein DBN05_000573 [Salmonella enterica subsp. enterica serovar Anderlecht]|nr:hypothetical protein [Salmonella enterica subsp. enterica serovar Anderlecht]EEJ3528471.1 hypothetical protein [Salmonella enterica subsp. enterica serovar Anderlecht]MIX06585.1 hypothetical protein [Salmonella enterica subsp. enterica serovar Anderlecht]
MTTTQPVAFSFQENHDVRIQVIDGEPWFCLKDVCDVLSIANASDLLSKQMDKDGVDKIYLIDRLGRKQLAAFINEPNLYRVIFRSNKPEARQFQDWVFNEVLPAIRKTGTYSQQPARRCDELNGRDMTNLKHLIHMMTNGMQHDQAWGNAVWYCLRQATGVRSPQPFAVSDLPVLADECRRIMLITGMMRNFMHTVETGMIKRVVRDGESAETFIGEMHASFVELLRNETATRRKMEAFEEKSLNTLRHRLI